VLTDNYSHVDRLWSILPGFYAWWFLCNSLFTQSKRQSLFDIKSDNDFRILAITLLITVWGLRLTYNFWRKGGYSLKEEDYRFIDIIVILSFIDSIKYYYFVF
jgi:steroid 5-alpha reductase family enzyme